MGDWTLAIGGSEHDASAALMRGLDIRVAIEQERLSRRKHGVAHWYESPIQRAVEYCLASEGISLKDVSRVVASDSVPARIYRELSGLDVRTYHHHLCHAASAAMMLPPGNVAGVLVYDGYGSIRGPVPGTTLRNLRETFSFFIFGPQGYECLGTTLGLAYIEPDEFPIGVTNSIGTLYEQVTGMLGYDLMESGKTMGLSAYGVPRHLETLERFVRYSDDPSNCFYCAADDPALTVTIEEILSKGRGSFRTRADLAASVQALIHKTLVHCMQFFKGRPIDCLCISGGCGLNTVANGFLVEHSPLNVPIFVPPHCGDAGLGLGALWLDEFHRTGAPPRLTFSGGPLMPGLSRPGRLYSCAERRDSVLEFYPRLVFDGTVTSASDLARVLAGGRIVGLFNGRSEIGPRALGGRSILASPRDPMVRERINRIIKGREPFQPLAPMILASEYEEYFLDARRADAFMLKIAVARERCRREAPAIVHVDGTARVQVIDEDGDPFLVELLRAFRRETNCAVLLNTSFNRRGEPIVESPRDAIDAFLAMALDGLYLDGEFYRQDSISAPR
jgi:carbamoyltransferase